MTRHRTIKLLLAGLMAALAFQPASLLACAACFGQSNSDMARGMNWGIFSLLAVIVAVLGGIASFFVYLGSKSSAELGPAGAISSKASNPPAADQASPAADI